MMLRLQSAREDLTQRMHVGQDSLEGLDRQLETVRADLETKGTSDVIQQLIALDRSGILMTIAPSDVLYEIAKVLPEEARLVSVRLSAAVSQGELELDAVTANPHAVVAFLGGLTESPLVRRAEVLEETPVLGGEYFYRIVAELGSTEGAK
jgi:Tfp pilus assembly protein PilN